MSKLSFRLNVFLGAFLSFFQASLADPLPAARSHDWSYTGVIGGIPNITNVCTTLSPGATAAQIGTAFDACAVAGGGVVELTEGTYSAASLGGTIILNGINTVLRGAGPDKTILQGGTIINMFSGFQVSHGANITAGGTKGSFTITVDSTLNLAVGRMIELDREDDPTLVTGPTYGGTRNITQVNVITNIAGSVLTLRNPLFYDFSTGTPKIKYYYSGNDKFTGVENLKLDHGGAAAAGMLISYCDSCWVKNVDSSNPGAYHFIVTATSNMEFRENFIHGGVGGPNNGGINFSGHYVFGANSSARIEQNIFNQTFPAVELNISSSGFAILYNYSHGSAVDLVSWTYDDNHGPFNIFNLYEGNIGEQWGTDGFFGGAGYGVAFRNYFSGVNRRVTAFGDAVWLLRLTRNYSVIGNVLGSALQNPIGYEGCSGPYIFRFGYPNLGNCSLTPPDAYTPPGGYPDADVAATLFRWGNYDHYNDAVRWEAGEVPAGVSVPADHVLPDSYAYAAKPSWWPSGMRWPGIGPDVFGGNGDSSGMVFKNPAEVCWENLNLVADGPYDYQSCFLATTSSCLSSPRGLRGVQSGICAVWDMIQ